MIFQRVICRESTLASPGRGRRLDSELVTDPPPPPTFSPSLFLYPFLIYVYLSRVRGVVTYTIEYEFSE